MAINWRVYGKDTVACKLSRADLPGFFRKKVIAGPNEAAIVVKDGHVEAVITESPMKLSGVADAVVSLFDPKSEKVRAVLDEIAGLFGGGADIEVFFVDLSPINFSIYLGETRTEHVISNDFDTSTMQDSLTSKIDLIKVSGSTGWVEATSGQIGGVLSGTSRRDITEINILAVSSDKEIIKAECLFTLSTDLQRSSQIISLLKGKLALASWDLASLIRDEYLSKVLIPEIASHRAADLRGNRSLLENLQNETFSKLSPTLATCGLSLDNFTINWGLTEGEVAEINCKRLNREDEATKFNHQRHLMEMGRELEIEKTRLANIQELKQSEVSGEENFKKLLLAAEIDRGLMLDVKRVDEVRIESQVRNIQLDIEKHESLLRLETQRSEEMQRLDLTDREWRQAHAQKTAQMELGDKEMQSMVKMQIEMASAKHEREMATRRQELDADSRRRQAEIEVSYQQRRLKLEESTHRMGMMERLVSKGLDTGSADNSVLRTMLEQSTEQEYATTSDDKVRSRAEAQAAKNNLETFKQAEERERQHQNKSTELATDMMQASKQTPGQTVVTGTGGSVVPPNINVVNLPDSSNPKDSPKKTSKCPSCSADVNANWRTCPYCGAALAHQKCASCGTKTEPNWKVCPECGHPLK